MVAKKKTNRKIDPKEKIWPEQAGETVTPAPKPKVKKETKKDPGVTISRKIREEFAAEKEAATMAGDAWVRVIDVDLDPENVGNGAFELDWNDKFITKLVRAGYEGKTDIDIVDRWFQTICRNIVMENYEQWEANNTGRRVDREDLGGGKSSIS